MITYKLIVVFLSSNFFYSSADPDAATIESRFNQLQTQLDIYSKKLAATQTELLATKNQLSTTRTELTETKIKVAQLEGKDEKRRLLLETDDSPVMFTAQLNKHAENLGEGQTIKFETTITNIRSGYDSVTGVFTCPVAGKYFFIVTIMSHYETWIETELMVNGTRKAFIYAGAGSARYNQGTSSAIVALNAGDRVWVQTVNTKLVGGSVHVYGGQWSSFSGFRISA